MEMEQPPNDAPLFLRRAGIIGDVHAEDETLAAVLDFLAGVPGLDALLCSGDVVDGMGDANQCCILLRAAGVLCVRGNHDRWFFEVQPYRTEGDGHPHHAIDSVSRAFLATLPPTRAFSTPRGPLLLCHGLGADDMTGVYPDDVGYALEANHRLHALVGEGAYRFVVNGHTHRHMVRTFDGLTIINAGTLQWGYEPCFFVIDFEAGRAECYNLRDARQIWVGKTFSLPAPPLQE